MGAGLVGEVDGAVDRFMFSHALVRDAIYERMSNSRRLRMHLRVGEALEAGGGHSAAGAGELAHHFFLARGVGGGGTGGAPRDPRGRGGRGVARLRGVGRALPPRARGARARAGRVAALRRPARARARAVAGGRGGGAARRTSRRPTAPGDAATRSSSPARRSASASATGRRARSTRSTRGCSRRRSTRSAPRTASRACC